MFIVCVGFVFDTVCLLQYNISINTSEVDPHPDSSHNGVLRPKNETIHSEKWVGR